MKYNITKSKLTLKAKRVMFGLGLSFVLTAGFTAPAFAAGGSNNASPCGAVHGAFNYRNSVYGVAGTPGNPNGTNLNSSAYGTGGGAPGSDNGAVGQQPGATGYNNSHTSCQQ